MARTFPLYSAKTSSVFAVKAVRDNDDLLVPAPNKDFRSESKENRVVVEFLVAPNAAARETIAVDLVVSKQSLEVISSIAESIRLAAKIVGQLVIFLFLSRTCINYMCSCSILRQTRRVMLCTPLHLWR